MTPQLDVLIPTWNRPCALAVTLGSLIGQSWRDFRLVISDQTEEGDPLQSGEVAAVLRVLATRGHEIELHKHLPRRGMAEQRAFLLNRARAPYALFIDDDLILEAFVIELMLGTLREQGCGFVGSAPIGLSFADDVRPHEQHIEFWRERVSPEVVLPASPEWERYRLHNAANVHHVQKYMKVTPAQPRLYRVAWVGGCVMYDTHKLRESGGFEFWDKLPADHAGEDVLAQLRVMARFGGCAVLPSGAYHQELPTTLGQRTVDAPKVLAADRDALLAGPG